MRVGSRGNSFLPINLTEDEFSAALSSTAVPEKMERSSGLPILTCRVLMDLDVLQQP